MGKMVVSSFKVCGISNHHYGCEHLVTDPGVLSPDLIDTDDSIGFTSEDVTSAIIKLWNFAL